MPGNCSYTSDELNLRRQCLVANVVTNHSAGGLGGGAADEPAGCTRPDHGGGEPPQRHLRPTHPLPPESLRLSGQRDVSKKK